MFTDIQLMKDNGLNAELSIGYSIQKRDEKNTAIITEYKLYEYSFLTSWAANELSTVQGIKGVKSVNGIIELIQKSYDLDYSDDRLILIETTLKALSNKEPLPSDTPKDEPLIEQQKDIITNFTQQIEWN